jgi:hypothetical protein
MAGDAGVLSLGRRRSHGDKERAALRDTTREHVD